MLLDFKYIEFYVGNAKQAAYFYQSVFGFDGYAYSGPETGNKEFVSYVLKQNKIYFIFSTALSSDHYISKWVDKHGDGVVDIAFKCNSIREDLSIALNGGAKLNNEYLEISDDFGVYKSASISTYGDVIHSLIDDEEYDGVWKPGFQSYNPHNICVNSPELILTDHVVGNVEDLKMNVWADYYEKAFNFKTFIEFTEDDIATKYSALRSKVMKSNNNRIKLPINEPANSQHMSRF